MCMCVCVQMEDVDGKKGQMRRLVFCKNHELIWTREGHARGRKVNSRGAIHTKEREWEKEEEEEEMAMQIGENITKLKTRNN